MNVSGRNAWPAPDQTQGPCSASEAGSNRSAVGYGVTAFTLAYEQETILSGYWSDHLSLLLGFWWSRVKFELCCHMVVL